MKYTLKMNHINFPAMSLYEAQKIIGKRNNPINKICEYKVKWQGYSIRQCTWEPIKNLKFVKHLIQQYQGQSKIKVLSSKNPCKDLKTISLKENDKHAENNLQRTVKKTSKCRQLKSNKSKIKISKLSRHIEKKNRQVRLTQLKMKESLRKQRYNRDLCEENIKNYGKISRDPFQLHFKNKVSQSQFRVLKACLKKGQKQLYYLVEQSQEKRLMKRQIVIREHSLALINFYEQRLIFTDKKSKIEK